MITYGNNIKDSQMSLQLISLESLFDKIVNPAQELSDMVHRLRLVRSIDKCRYASQKSCLPFFVCARFEPSIRRAENFAYLEYFVIDVDHLSSQGVVLPDMKKLICADPRVVLCYTSPSMDGLKVLFRLSERCYDPGKYKLFYKLFANEFARALSLEKNVDTCTCDVTRACFLCADSEAYYNPLAETVDMNTYLAPDDSQNFWDLWHMEDSTPAEYVCEEERCPDPDEETMANIRAQLNPSGRKPKPKREVYVPEILNDVIDTVREYICKTGLEVTDVVDIQYGKQIHIKSVQRQAEINLFYGRRGFSVVKSPKTGTDPELNDMCAELVRICVEVA